MNLKRLLSFLIVPLLLTACPSGRNRADAPDLGKLPRTILSGEQGPFHVQGIAVDLERGYIYFSFTTKLLKMDLAGNLIGSVDGLTGHLGCLTMNPADGRVYGSLEYKDDAIGKGILIAEIQQNSNTTYRIYDFGRLGADGKPRELHIDKAVDVTRLEPPTRSCKPQGEPQQHDGYCYTLLASCEYFTVTRMDVEKSVSLNADNKSFHSLLCLEGDAVVQCNGQELSMTKGESIFLPAGTGAYTVSGTCQFLFTTV